MKHDEFFNLMLTNNGFTFIGMAHVDVMRFIENETKG